MRILFLIPEIRLARYTLPFWLKRLNPPESPHLGVAYLCEILKQNGHIVKVVDLQLKSKAYANRTIKKFKPNVIGFTITSYCTEKVYNYIKKIKEQYPRTPVIVGGAHPSCVGKNVLKQCREIDFAVIGEGEQIILELLNAIKKNKGFEEIDGIGYRNNGKIIANKPHKFIDNLDEIPFPRYHEFDLPKYQDWKQNSISMTTSRGCPFSCVYCSVFQSMGKKFRTRTAENVVKEIEYWYKRGIKKFNFNDDCFTLKPKRVEEICDLIIKKNLKIEYRLYNGIKVDLLTKELVHKMKLAGFTSTSLGIETGNEETMRHIKKNINFDQVFKAIKWLKQEKITTIGNFIIGHPYETYQKGLDTIKMSEKIETDYINFNNAIPYP
tara:strand:+ start:315 stop:1457 length:1143 start_codon:yes stop_codon:yes gene_type:complete